MHFSSSPNSFSLFSCLSASLPASSLCAACQLASNINEVSLISNDVQINTKSKRTTLVCTHKWFETIVSNSSGLVRMSILSKFQLVPYIWCRKALKHNRVSGASLVESFAPMQHRCSRTLNPMRGLCMKRYNCSYFVHFKTFFIAKKKWAGTTAATVLLSAVSFSLQQHHCPVIIMHTHSKPSPNVAIQV